MSITYAIIRNHDGEITVESKEGVGTTFRVMLPVVERISLWPLPKIHLCFGRQAQFLADHVLPLPSPYVSITAGFDILKFYPNPSALKGWNVCVIDVGTQRVISQLNHISIAQSPVRDQRRNV